MDSTAQADPAVHMLSRQMQWMIVPFVVLSGTAAVQLWVFPGETDRFFSWTLRPPLSAMIMGGGYAAGFVLSLLSYRRVPWAVTRLATYTILLFVTVMSAATLLHLDRMHFDSEVATAQFAAWLWLVVYIVVPPLLAAMAVWEHRRPGVDPPREAPLGRGLRKALAVQGAVMLTSAVALFVFPLSMARVWPWPITPLSARAIAAWFVAIGFAGVWAVVENDLERLRPAAITYAVLGILWLVSVGRGADDVLWGRLSAWVFIAWVACITVTGIVGWWRCTEHRAARANPVLDDPAPARRLAGS
jgi:hypothetical protein